MKLIREDSGKPFSSLLSCVTSVTSDWLVSNSLQEPSPPVNVNGTKFHDRLPECLRTARQKLKQSIVVIMEPEMKCHSFVDVSSTNVCCYVAA